MIEVNQLTKRFGSIVAVDHISFTVERGDVLAFLGPNGAGKSTTMKMITGFLAPDFGNITVDNLDVALYPIQVKSRIGYLPEGIPLYGEMPVLSFLKFAGKIRGLKNRGLEASITEVVSALQLDDVLQQTISTLSKGYQRRVGLAQALLNDPDVLILDEPTDGLDPNQKSQIRLLLRKLSVNKAIILSTHNLEEVNAVCNKVIIIHKGRIVFAGTPGELIELSDSYNAVCIEFEKPVTAEIMAKLQNLPQISRIENIGEEGTGIRLFSRNRRSIVDEVNQIVRHGDSIRTFSIDQGNLDDVFRNLTEIQNPVSSTIESTD